MLNIYHGALTCCIINIILATLTYKNNLLKKTQIYLMLYKLSDE
jgi:hypothetical protein